MVLLACFGAVIAVDLAATGSAIARLNRQLKQIDALAGRIRELSDELGENLADKVLEAAEKGTAWKEELDEQTKQLRVDAAERKEERSQERLRRRRQRQQELAELREKLEHALDGHAFGQRRLMRAFPKMRSIQHHQALQRLRRRMERKEQS